MCGSCSSSLRLRSRSRRSPRTGDARAGTRADTPTRGGELKLLGTSDIFNIDTVSAYYTVSNLLERAWTRQLVSYVNAPTFPGSIKLAADVAAALPVNGNGISADGKTYTFKIRQGVQWDTSPPRQVTADDFVREFKMLCNPISPVGAPGYFTSTIVGMKAYCDGFAKVKKPTVAGIAAYVSRPQARRRRRDRPLDAHVQAAAARGGLPQHPDDGLRLRAAGRVRQVPARQRGTAPAHDRGRPVQDHQLHRDEGLHARAQSRLDAGQRSAAPRLRGQDHDHRGPELHQRAAADRGGHGRHRVGHPAAQPGPPAPDLRQRQGADPRPDGPVLRRHRLLPRAQPVRAA